MGAIEDLVAGLIGAPAQKAIAEENYYYKFGAVPDALSGSIQQIASQAPGRFSTKDLLIGSLLTGLTGGIFKGLGDTYQNKLTTRYLDNANSLLAGDESNPQGLPPSLFRANQDVVRMFQMRKGLEDAAAEKDLKRQVDSQIELATNPKIREAKLEDAISLRNSSLDNPKSTEVIKEKGALDKLQQSFDFIDSKFERAKDLVGAEAAVGLNTPFNTTKGNELRGLQDSVILQIDNALGREINSDVRNRIKSLTPTSYDSKDTIETKKNNLKELLVSLAAPTPVLDAATGGASGDWAPGATQSTGSSSSPPHEPSPGMKWQRSNLGNWREVPIG